MNTYWTLERIKNGLEQFYKDSGRYPTSREIDASTFLPSSRQIQRRFGGLPSLREQLKLDGPRDFTTGEYSSKRAHKINNRAKTIEREVYEYLVGCFGKTCVHREYPFTDDSRYRTDFYVYYRGGNFCADVFYPQDRYSLIGCLNRKMRTFKNSISLIPYPIIFLMANKSIAEDEIERLIANKKNKLNLNQHIMSFNQFQKFCGGKARLDLI